ncbi:hypothetical protein [Pontixanthobacter sp.]|uniref:hypothetical protein n=1 Tax=Pontixanthobacter sp. TaxID=2792078 RepID=UPI003C7E8EE0
MPAFISRHVLLAGTVLPLLILGACSSEADDGAAGEMDPAAEQALNDQIMVDPDLANQNEANAALTGGTDQSIPPENMTPEAINAAREAAFALVGGSAGFKDLPAPERLERSIPPSSTLTAAARAAASPGGANCAEKVEYSAAWAAKLPADFPVYPRGTTKEAAGTDVGDCSLRVVNYLTPVPLDEVLKFYYSRALSAGYSSEHVTYDGDNIISGMKGSGSYVVYGRSLPSGLTQIDLVTSGN